MTVFSFDVFDTLVTRTVFHPKDVFWLVQSKLSSSGDHAFPQALSRGFWGARVWSEFIARRRSSREDVGYDEIYSVLAELYCLDSVAVDRLKAIELDVERSVLVPIDGALEIVGDARKKGRIVFLSDMYLPTDFVSQVLEKFSFKTIEEPLYVSGDIGVTKGSGNLFRKAIADLGLEPQDLVHCGDHLYSDCRTPKKLGVRIPPQVSPHRLRPGMGRFGYLLEILQARLRMGFII